MFSLACLLCESKFLRLLFSILVNGSFCSYCDFIFFMSLFLYYFVPTIVSSVLLIKMVLLFHKIIGLDYICHVLKEIWKCAECVWVLNSNLCWSSQWSFELIKVDKLTRWSPPLILAPSKIFLLLVNIILILQKKKMIFLIEREIIAFFCLEWVIYIQL